MQFRCNSWKAIKKNIGLLLGYLLEDKCKLEIQATHLKMWQNQEMTTVTVSRNSNVYNSKVQIILNSH